MGMRNAKRSMQKRTQSEHHHVKKPTQEQTCRYEDNESNKSSDEMPTGSQAKRDYALS